MKTLAATWLLSLALALTGCKQSPSKPKQDQTEPGPTAQQGQNTTPQVQPGQPAAPAARPAQPAQPGTTAEQPGQTTLTDAQILGVLETINGGEVAAARYVMAHAPQASVKALATHLETDHAAALTQEKQLAAQMHLQPDMHSPLATQLSRDQATMMTALRSKSGEALGRAYVDDQVAGHTGAVAMVHDRLIPAAHLPSLRAHLQSFLTTIRGHLQRARAVQQSLGPRASR